MVVKRSWKSCNLNEAANLGREGGGRTTELRDKSDELSE